MIKQKQKAVKISTKFDVRTSMKAMLAFERLPTKVQRQIRIAVEELAATTTLMLAITVTVFSGE